MSIARLLLRYFAAFVIATLAISGVQVLKGHPLRYAAIQGLLWGGISSTLYIVAYYINTRKMAACPVDNDTKGPGA